MKLVRRRRALECALALLFALACVSAQAAVQVVTNTNDSGVGSLRRTVTTASGGDTIEFNIPTRASAGGYSSVFFGNPAAEAHGGGVANFGSLTLIHSTLANNKAAGGKSL